jgi:hypothetical protein
MTDPVYLQWWQLILGIIISLIAQGILFYWAYKKFPHEKVALEADASRDFMEAARMAGELLKDAQAEVKEYKKEKIGFLQLIETLKADGIKKDQEIASLKQRVKILEDTINKDPNGVGSIGE